ncbi:hypothetical protein [Thauera butanivorans]|uniref:COG4648 family protein n=1 Tax=Thauera butanivorans TaxID=86174 RepID=UPI000838B8DD|nr:hypothetical protein [Thauera butanivorans]
MRSADTADLLRGLAMLPLLAVWALASHYSSAGDVHPAFGAVLGVAPLVIATVLLLWRIPSAPLRYAACAAGVVLLVWLWPQLLHNIALLYYLQHLSSHVALGMVFGHTLIGPGEALVTQLARAIQPDGQLSARQIRYTRQVSIAWTAFFFGNALLSTLLFAFAPTAVWSIHANLLTGPLIGLIFLIEYLVRLRVLSVEERPGFVSAIRAWRNAPQSKTSRTVS